MGRRDPRLLVRLGTQINGIDIAVGQGSQVRRRAGTNSDASCWKAGR